MLKTIARIIIGIVFLFSGFVKAVDPVGGAIKISEYLEVVGLHNTDTLSLVFAILLSTLEFILGFQLLYGFKVKKAALPTMVFMLLFTLITFYNVAIEELVTDCGCFGDALKMSNAQTFFKNIILLPISVFIFYKRNEYQSTLNDTKQYIGVFLGLAFILGISIYSLIHLPILDFRPYNVGQNIPEAMSIPEGAPQSEYETTFILEKDGKRQEFDMNNYPYDDTTWVFIDQKSVLIKEGYQPAIQSFILETADGYNMSDELLENDQPVFLVIAPKTHKASEKNIEALKAIHNMCMESDYPFYVVTASLSDEYFEFDAKHSAAFEYLSADETMLKTIIRSNPGLIILNKGTIIAKYSHSDLPNAKDLKKPLSHVLTSYKSINNKWLLAVCGLLLVGSVVILYRL